jgi:hypothetical protein
MPMINEPTTAERYSSRGGAAWLLLVTEVTVGVMAMICGPLLIITDGLGMSREELDATPFTSFVIPGIVLLLVGASLTIAGLAFLRRRSWGAMASLGAGCLLLGWVLVEGYWIDAGRPLQVAIAAAAFIIIGASLRLWQYA